MADNEGTPAPATEGAPVDAVSSEQVTQADISVAELREWLRRWVADATGQAVEQITVDRPMEEFGLASRDALALGGDIEELTGVVLTATVVYQHPTIASLAERIVNGEPDAPEESGNEDIYTALTADEAHDIAIVGLSTRLPGAGDTPESTWEFLIGGGDAIRERPEGRWSEFTADPQVAKAVEEGNTLGGYLDQEVVKGFDAEFFAMSPIEVERVDPQQRLMMELTWEALEHARIPASELRGEAVGVYIGSTGNDFQLLAALGLGDPDPNVPASAEAYAIMGSVSSIIPNRVSYFYDFRGPSVSVDTACSSTLVAVHQAVRALRAGEADLAVAGGVNMLLAPLATLGFDRNGGVAANGRIKAFSSDADGMVRSEGGGLVVLKRLVDAERDGDRILAVVKGSAINNDGRSNGLLAPNPDAQADVLRRAYRDAGIKPSTVDYIEAHGTGTLIGDPIEADALGRVVGRGRDADKPALLGSAKTNFGHLESGAGAASLAKVLMSFQHNVIPGNLHFAGPHPFIPFEQANLKVVDAATEFPRYSGVATVGVSGFGFGGTNAHIVIQEYVPSAAVSEPGASDLDGESAKLAETDGAETADLARTDELAGVGGAAHDGAAPEPEWTAERTEPLPVILAVSGYLPSRRRRAAGELADWLESAGSEVPLADVARSLARRSHWRSRGVVIARTNEEAVAGLRAIAEGKPGAGVFTADAPAVKAPIWVLSGFGAQHRKMGKQLYAENSIFRRAVDEVDELVQDEAGYSIREMILDDGQDYDVGTSQVGIFTVQIGLAAVLRAHGAEPEAVVGHSMGEVAGAYIAGGLALEDAVRVICARSRLMGEGEAMITEDDVRNMALVELGVADVEKLLPEYPDVEMAVFAAPTNTVIGGPRDQVAAIVAQVEAAGKFARVLQTRGAGHTSQMDPLLGELAAELAGIEPTALRHGLYSTVHKEEFFRAGHDPIHDEDYWVKNMRHAVYFTNAVQNAVDAGHTTFLELAPNSVALMQVLGTTFAAGVHDAQLIPTLKRKEDESAGVVGALAQLYVHGHKVDLPSLLPAGEFADIPRTTFVRKEFWPKAKIAAGGGSDRIPGAHVALPDGRHVWEVQAGPVGDLTALARAAAGQVLADVALGATVTHAPAPIVGTLTTTLTPHPGGASVQVHARSGANFTLLLDAVVTSGAPLPESAVVTPVEQAVVAADSVEVIVGADSFGDRWDPNGTQTIEDRLALIVAESMGYAVEDLPMEIPLMELGLDSLMAMRIKNRVEYEFDIPQLQIQAVRDANLAEVGKVLRYAIDHRDEVQAIADKQAAGEDISVDGGFAAAARAALAAGEDPDAIAKAVAGQADNSAGGAGALGAEEASDAGESGIQANGLGAQGVSDAGVESAARVNGTGAQQDSDAVAKTAAAKAGNSTAQVNGSTAGIGEAAPRPGATVETIADEAERAETTGSVAEEQSKVGADATDSVLAGFGAQGGGADEEDVPPRDAPERLTYATWAIVTGKSAGGIFNTLPILEEEVAEKLAARLSERIGAELTVDDVLDCETIEQLSDIVRTLQDTGAELDGFVRTLRAPVAGSNAVPVFVFHPAGGNTLVYEPLLKRLPSDTPMFGVERAEGEIEERARQYVPQLRKIQGDGPFILYGWSLGAVLAMACAQQLRAEGADVALVGLIDLAIPADPEDNSSAERVRRIERYQEFAKKTYGVQGELPREQLEELAAADDEEQFTIISDLVKISGTKIPGGVLEHQRTSWIEFRALARVTPTRYDGRVALYLADRYHDGAIELEPRFANRRPNGGWDEYVRNLDIVRIPGDHLQIVDEPRIGKIGADLTAKLIAIEAKGTK
ncbi:polyketide synthase Pks13 [Nocardia bovistercoris]|uniref:Acyltransferase domain-containing protein n=1 Tax=Nocardia bovistercoris TaxID=2785916 RepID=A0A931IED9_9NOCA|nr:polyketide synthase Pks13 [Nocardia bovistercoris]MBH0779008.1 acyltransferase domain-containing protein [Nocardia bovistercoris]